eukprot:jgi/Orpsp1_1/1180198/evm.model.c7180000072480.1
MLGIQNNNNNNNNNNEILLLSSDIIKENETELEFMNKKYCLKVQLKENINDDNNNEDKIIVLNVENLNYIERFIYEIEMNYNEFSKLKLFRMCDTIEEIYDFISNLINEKIISIKDIINGNSLTLLIKSKFYGFKDPIIANIKLLKKDRSNNDLIDKLYKILEDKNNEQNVKIESNQVVNISSNTTNNKPLIIKPTDDHDVMKQVSINVNVPQPKIESCKSVSFNSCGTFTINPSNGKDVMKKVSVTVDIPVHTVPVISKIQLFKKDTYDYTYSLSSFTKITSDKTIVIPSNGILLYVLIYEKNNYQISEVINIGSGECNFSFEGSTLSLPYYYKLINNKIINEDHWVYLMDNNNFDIQYLEILIKNRNSNSLVRNNINNYLPTISNIQIFLEGTYDYTYSLSTFTKITGDKTVDIPSNGVLLYVCSDNNDSYEVSELINTNDKELTFSFKDPSRLYYYKIINDKIINKNHRINLKGINDNIIQSIYIYCNIKYSENL